MTGSGGENTNSHGCGSSSKKQTQEPLLSTILAQHGFIESRSDIFSSWSQLPRSDPVVMYDEPCENWDWGREFSAFEDGRRRQAIDQPGLPRADADASFTLSNEEKDIPLPVEEPDRPDHDSIPAHLADGPRSLTTKLAGNNVVNSPLAAEDKIALAEPAQAVPPMLPVPTSTHSEAPPTLPRNLYPRNTSSMKNSASKPPQLPATLMKPDIGQITPIPPPSAEEKAIIENLRKQAQPPTANPLSRHSLASSAPAEREASLPPFPLAQHSRFRAARRRHAGTPVGQGTTPAVSATGPGNGRATSAPAASLQPPSVASAAPVSGYRLERGGLFVRSLQRTSDNRRLTFERREYTHPAASRESMGFQQQQTGDTLLYQQYQGAQGQQWEDQLPYPAQTVPWDPMSLPQTGWEGHPGSGNGYDPYVGPYSPHQFPLTTLHPYDEEQRLWQGNQGNNALEGYLDRYYPLDVTQQGSPTIVSPFTARSGLPNPAYQSAGPFYAPGIPGSPAAAAASVAGSVPAYLGHGSQMARDDDALQGRRGYQNSGGIQCTRVPTAPDNLIDPRLLGLADKDGGGEE
ncbi:hypothetical protein EsH8_VII_000314 [Colletotrichum jinshuiense]